MNSSGFVLTNRMWGGIKDKLPGWQGSTGRTAADNRLFLIAVLWRVGTGLPWQDFPSEFGKRSSVVVRFLRRAEKGVFESIFKELSASLDFERAQADGTVVRAR